MKKILSAINNEDGSIIAIAILVMVLVTILVISAVRDTSTELQIARNDVIYKENMFQAEGAVREAVQRIEDMANPLDNLIPGTTTLSWIVQPGFNPQTNTWTAANSQSSALGNTAGYCVQFNGISSGSGIDMTESTRLYDFTVYGNSTLDDGQCQVMVGYRIRF